MSLVEQLCALVLVYGSSGRRCLERVAGGELRLTTHGRQSQNADFLTQPLHTEEFRFHQACDELAVISYADLFLFSRYFGDLSCLNTLLSDVYYMLRSVPRCSKIEDNAHCWAESGCHRLHQYT